MALRSCPMISSNAYIPQHKNKQSKFFLHLCKTSKYQNCQHLASKTQNKFAASFTVYALAFIQNDLVEEARQVFSDWYSQVVRLYKGEKYAEFEWTVGPIPIEYVCFSKF